MKILVTGSEGFIGKQLCRELEARGDEVWRLDRMVHARYYPHEKRRVYCDVSNLDSCKRAIRESNPEIVVHLAAIATTDLYMYNHPNEMIQVTLNGTVNMAHAFASCVEEISEFKKQFVYASSSEIYGNAANPPFTEEATPHPCNIYAVSKYAGELFLKDEWSKAYGIPYTIMRNFNTYGNVGYQRTLIDRCVKEMLAGNPTVKLGNANTVRDWEYVDDHVSSYLTVIGNPKSFNETFNFCVGLPFKISETVSIIKDITNYKGEIEWNTGFQRKNDVQLLHGDPSKAKRVLGWEAKYNLHEGLSKYVEQLQGNP